MKNKGFSVIAGRVEWMDRGLSVTDAPAGGGASPNSVSRSDE